MKPTNMNSRKVWKPLALLPLALELGSGKCHNGWNVCGFSYGYIKRHNAKANTQVILLKELPGIHSILSGKSPTEKAGTNNKI